MMFTAKLVVGLVLPRCARENSARKGAYCSGEKAVGLSKRLVMRST